MATDWSILLRQLRKEAGLTQDQVAKEIGTNRSYVAQVETGRSGLRLETLEAWLEACGAAISVVPADQAEQEAVQDFVRFLRTSRPDSRATVMTMMRALLAE